MGCYRAWREWNYLPKAEGEGAVQDSQGELASEVASAPLEIIDLLIFILVIAGVIVLGYWTMRLRPPRSRKKDRF